MADFSDDELLSELGIDLTPVKSVTYTAKEERIISGFEEIGQFYELNQRLPINSFEADIFERLYATRLEQIKKMPEAIELLSDFDKFGLLQEQAIEPLELNDEDLLAELDIDGGDKNIVVLNHVRNNSDRKEAELIGRQTICENFEVYRKLFDQVQLDLNNQDRYTERYAKNNILDKHDWFILDGQLTYIADIGEYFETSDGHTDARLNVIFSNGTESNILMRSLTRALYKDPKGRRVLLKSNFGSLFLEENLQPESKIVEIKSGSIYVLKSLSTEPYIAENRNIIHKIGVTTGDVNKRIVNAKLDATYLLADVEVIATYDIPINIVPHKLENLIHKFLQTSRLDIEIKDRFDNVVRPNEWFLVPISIIQEVINKIQDGSIINYKYDASNVSLRKIE